MAKTKARLDELLMKRRLFDDLKVAQGWIVAGNVLVGGERCTKPGARHLTDVVIALRKEVEKYASRGGHKLEAALGAFAVDVTGMVVLDAGACTGGFSDCLLQKGAKRVYAADVGYGQLRGRLAADPRVVNLERTNISDLRASQLVPPIDLCVFDLSYVSATVAAPILARLFVGRPHIIGLLKPLYEKLRQDRKTDPAELKGAVGRVVESLAESGLRVRSVIVSPILGGRGSVEFLIEIVPGDGAVADGSICERAIEDLGAHPPMADGEG